MLAYACFCLLTNPPRGSKRRSEEEWPADADGGPKKNRIDVPAALAAEPVPFGPGMAATPIQRRLRSRDGKK
jgi:hypothetical protein